MQDLEPYYNWREYYTSEEDALSPFYQKEYNEFEFTNTIYNYYIHPQWDEFGSNTLYLKILFADYEQGFVIIELIGEWNDCLHNDIMYLKRDLIDILMRNNISKFILIGENVLNFHAGDDCYYEEWFDDVEEGWIALVNFRDYVEDEIKSVHLDQYLMMGNPINTMNWRKLSPQALFSLIDEMTKKRLQPPSVNY